MIGSSRASQRGLAAPDTPAGIGEGRSGRSKDYGKVAR